MSCSEGRQYRERHCGVCNLSFHSIYYCSDRRCRVVPLHRERMRSTAVKLIADLAFSAYFSPFKLQLKSYSACGGHSVIVQARGRPASLFVLERNSHPDSVFGDALFPSSYLICAEMPAKDSPRLVQVEVVIFVAHEMFPGIVGRFLMATEGDTVEYCTRPGIQGGFVIA